MKINLYICEIYRKRGAKLKKPISYKLLFSIVLIFSFVMFLRNGVVYAAQNYDGSTIGKDVEVNKVWKITFNRSLDKSTVNSSNIIVKDSNGQVVSAGLNTENNGCTVSITPQVNYEYGRDYTVVIRGGIKTSEGIELGRDVQFKFSTKKSPDKSTNGKYTVTIDASHGGQDSGSLSDSGAKEKDVNLSVALKTGEILKQNGVNVVYTRTEDKALDDNARADISNKSNSSEFVSIHANSYSKDKNVKGIETYYSAQNKSDQSKAEAESVQKQIVKFTGSQDRGIKEASAEKEEKFSKINAPSIMVYLGFMTNQSESDALSSSDFQNKSAKGIAQGILMSLNLAYEDKDENQNNEGDTKVPPNSGKNPTVVIDPGHGRGDDVGSSGNGYQEDDVTLDVALKTGAILKNKGVNVVYTRTTDERKTSSATVTQSLQKRCDVANNSGAKFMVSIHTNAFDSSSAEGTETLYYTGSSEGQKLASLIQKNIVGAIGTYDRGLKDGSWLYITRNTKITTVLTEPGFLTNSKDASILGNDSGRQKTAAAIAKAICTALGIS